ncbi:MAG: FkbM family methyltransferase [Pseudomonadota bacterium]|nr:FkbM family methyltransferase [Pseudomonadota bacterium]
MIEALPKDFFLTLVDVGSAGGLHPRWRPLRPILSGILFDPREAAASGSLGPGKTRVYPVALSDQSGEADLHITALPNMSSFLQPDQAVFGRYWKKGAHADVVSRERVQVERLDTLANADGFQPHVLKVDTQGSELMVLKGAQDSLRSVMLAEVEVSFFQRYVGQPVFADIEEWMKQQGFELIELYRLKRYRAANSLGIRGSPVGDGQRSGRVAYADAIFMRNEAAVLASSADDGGTGLLRAMITLLAYGKADHAAALLDRGGELLPVERNKAIGAALRALNGWRLIPRIAALAKRSRY